VNNTPDASFAIFFKYALYFLGFRQIASDGIDFRAVFVLIRSIFWKSLPCDSGNAIKGGWVGVVIIIYRDNFISSRFLQTVYYVRAC
jgi:hypothetical protein